MDYIGQLEAGQAGKLIPDEGETTAAIRRRLGAAAELLGKSLVVNRLGDVVYFWAEGEGPEPPPAASQDQDRVAQGLFIALVQSSSR